MYGVRAALPLADTMPIVGARVRAVCDRLQAVATRRLAALGIDHLPGTARLGPARFWSLPLLVRDG